MNTQSLQAQPLLDEAAVARFHRDGFVVGERLLDDAQVDELRAAFDRVIADQDDERQPQPVRIARIGEGDDPVWQVVNIHMASPAFRRLVGDQRIAESIARLTGARELRVWHDQIQYKPPRHGGVNWWHQDAPYWPVVRPMTEVSAWIALDEVDEDNGCMSMVPGSHLWGDAIEHLHAQRGNGFDELPERYRDHDVRIVRCPVAAGAVHFHHALTWHGSHGNHSERPRRALAIHYMAEDARFVADAEHCMKPFIDAADGEPIRGDAFPLVWPGS